MSEVTEVADLVYPLSSITSTSSTTSITSQKTKRRPFQAGVLFSCEQLTCQDGS